MTTASVERAVEERVAAAAAGWFPGSAGSPSVCLRCLSRRPRSALYAVHLGDEERPRMVAKVRTGVLPQGPSTERRPRLSTGSPSVSELTALEYAGLEAIFSTFGPAHARFGVVRPLDHMVAENVILMDYMEATTLRDVLVGESRLALRRRTPARGGAESPWQRAGAWLREFQDANPPQGQPSRQRDRQDVVERFEAYRDFLTSRVGASSGAVAADGARLAADVLPDRMPMAVGHGDFAPRNVFLGEDGRVTVLDPLPRWAVPRYEDLCRLLVGMRLLGLQLHSHGAAFSRRDVERHELEVVRGYFGEDAVPTAQLRCYELLILLDKWAALVDIPGRGWRARVTSASVRSASGFLRSQARRLLEPVPAHGS